MKKPYLIDLPVLLIFFNRPDTFEKVFEQVKIARPSKLFLACDGARENNSDDEQRIKMCKDIASEIDWECEVYTNYSEKNMGCGLKPSSSIKWALEIVDRIVILEDDCVPDQSFFQYMAELLEKYKDDERIGMISGLNHFERWNCDKYSYFFAKNGAIWGWGTWRRVWEDYDYKVSSINNPYIQKLIYNDIKLKRAKHTRVNGWVKTSIKVSNGGNISYWDSQFGYLKFYKGYLTIVPKNNLIHNIGVGAYSTHAVALNNNVWKKGMLHFIPTTPLKMPLVHPEFIIRDHSYDDAVDRKFAFPNFFNKYLGKAKRFLKKIISK